MGSNWQRRHNGDLDQDPSLIQMAAFNSGETPHEWFSRLMSRASSASSDPPLMVPSRSGVPGSASTPAALVVAPMVDQSDLPFRKLCARHGANVVYSPMIHSRMFLDDESYRQKFMPASSVPGGGRDDVPLFLQFCGHDKDVLLKATSAVQDMCDAVDLNCGCPQGIARRGNYGAFLLEKGDNLVEIVSHLSQNLKCRVSVKVRLLPTGLEDSLKLYNRLIDAGASLLTVHGRNRHQKGQRTGPCSWESIKAVVSLLGHRIPIIANGGISSSEDVRRCLEETGAAGVMSSERILELPSLFREVGVVGSHSTGPSRLKLALEYVELANECPPDLGGQGNGHKCVRGHLQKMLYAELQADDSLRDRLCEASDYETFKQIVSDAIAKLEPREDDTALSLETSWYTRHRVPNMENGASKLDMNQIELEDDFGCCAAGLFGGGGWGGDEQQEQYEGGGDEDEN